MATTVRAHARFSSSVTYDSYVEASIAAALTQISSATLITRDADTKEWVRTGMPTQYNPTWVGFRSHRIAAPVTITGDITFRVHCLASVAGAGRAHAKLFKRTVGGSNVETLIAEADEDVDIPITATAHQFIATPPAPVALAPGERLLYRIYVKRRSADFDTATFTLRYDHATTGLTYFILTEDATFILDSVILIPRRTAVAAIGNFFDLLPTRGVTTTTTGVVNTVASGTEVQWTRTAGGTVLEWISPRFTGPWVFHTAGQFGYTANFLTAHESNLAANCAVRLKLFRRRPDGTETLVMTSSYASELTTTASRVQLPTATFAETNFVEDDRLVARAYIIPIGTMGGSQTCTIGYDHNASANGDTSFSVIDMSEFKAEGDPGASPAPSGLATMGMGT